MKKLSRLIFALILFMVLVVSIIFVRFNSEPTVIFIGNLQIWELPLSVLVIGAFVAGSLLGLVIGLRIFRTMKDKAEIFISKGKLGKVEGQLANLKMKSSSDQN